MRNTFSLHHMAAAAIAAVLGTVGTPAGSAVIVAGPYFSNPAAASFVSGLNLSLPGAQIWMGTGALASLSANAGSQVELGSLYLGQSHAATAQLDGAGTVLRLNSPGDQARLTIGAGSAASLSVTGGALLDGRWQSGNCLSGLHFCGSFIGDATGASGELLVSGAGSEARLLGPLMMASARVGANGFGTAGGTAAADVRVLAGGLLRTHEVVTGLAWTSPGTNGQETSVAQATVDGAGSSWLLEANTISGAQAGADFARGPGASATLHISNGGRLEVQGAPGLNYGLRLGAGGSFSGSVTGTDSVLWMSGSSDWGFFHLADGGGTARLDVGNGGKIGGARWVQVGFMGGNATLNIGAGGVADFSNAGVQVGNTSTGRLQVTAGGHLYARELNIGVNHQNGPTRGTGSAHLDGAGSLITLGGVDTNRLVVGGWGDGELTVSGGALLDGTLDAAACLGRWCGTRIGQTAGATARMTVTGAGSEVRLLGDLGIGEVFVARQEVEGWTGGEINGTTRARVEVLAGGRLVTEIVRTGGAVTASQGGGERSFVELAIDGAGSTWLVTGNSQQDAQLTLSENPARVVHTALDISNGGLLQIQSQPGRQAGVDLASGGQSVTMIRDASSRLEISGATSRLVVGNSQGGNATLAVKDGAAVVQNGSNWSYLNIGETQATGRVEISGGGQVSGARQVNVGSGGSGSLLIDGAGSLLSTDRRGSFVGQLNIGSSGSGRLDVLGGGAASVFALQVGNGFDHAGSAGQAVIDGAGSRVTADAIDWHRLGLENGGLTVSGGGVLDAASNAAGCVGHWCGAFLANNAGGDVRLTVTGAGSRASFLSNLIAGGNYVTAPPATPYSLGEPGAASLVLIEVLAGGVLETEAASLGHGPQGPSTLGTEAATVKVKLDGAGSRWTLTPNTQGGSSGATTLATGLNGGANTDVSIAVSGGARLELIAQAGQTGNLQLARDGGISALSVVGNGSELAMSGGTTRTLLIGRNQGQASVVLMDGARLSGASNVVVGLNQGSSTAAGLLMLDGALTRGQISGGSALLRVGQGAWGMTQLSHGAQLGVDGSQSAFVTVGSYNFNAAGSAILSLADPGTRLDVRTGGGTALSNASMTVGASFGMLDVLDGAQLRLEGGFESTPATPLLTTLTIGSSTTLSSGLLPGQGYMTVRGSGSRVEVGGADPRVMIGMNGGLGIANLQDGAVLATSYVGVGGNGGQGQLNLSAARVELAGQWTSQLLGPRLAVGFGSGSTGLVRLAAGAEVVLDGRGGPDRAALVLGGVTNTPLGSGRLLASGGSSLTLLGAGSALFGQTGSGIGDFSGASRLDLDGGTLFIGRYAGATGELHLREASQAHAGTVLVGASALGVDGGQGWLQVTGGSALHANRLDIGSTSLLSGSGLLDVGLLTNRGSINPGDSPGTLQLTGNFVNEAGGRLVLEVEADGHGGFVTDRLAFASGASIDLGAALIEFRFLGATDPNAFQASGGFRIDSFLSQAGAPLDHGLLGGVSYAASSNAYQFTSFTFSAEGGAVFTAQPVPEPGTWVMLLSGLLCVGWLARQRRSKPSCGV